MSDDLHFSKLIGESLALAMNQLPVQAAPMVKGASQGVTTAADQGENDLRRKACKAASLAYINAGRRDSRECVVFAKMAAAEEWDNALDPWLDVALDVFGAAQEQKDEMYKLAAIGAASIGKKALGGIAALAPQTLAYLAGGAALGGGSLGALWWLANHDAKADSDEMTLMKAKRDYYRALTDEISGELERRGLAQQGPLQKPKVMDALRDSAL